MADINRRKKPYTAALIELERSKWEQLRSEFKCSEPTIRHALRGFEGTYLAACIRREAIKAGGRKVRTITEYFNEETQQWEQEK
jgi:hypothetical protein